MEKIIEKRLKSYPYIRDNFTQETIDIIANDIADDIRKEYQITIGNGPEYKRELKRL